MKGGLLMGSSRISDTCWLSASSSSLLSLYLSFLESLVILLTSDILLAELLRFILFMQPQPLGSSTAGFLSNRSIFLASFSTWLHSTSELLNGLISDSELFSSVASRMVLFWSLDSMLRLIQQFSRFWRESSMSSSLWQYLFSFWRGACPVIQLEWWQSVLMPYLEQTSWRSSRLSLCSCLSSSCSSLSRSLRLIRSCLMNDSTSICMSWVAIELLSVRATTGNGGKLPNSFLAGYGLLGFGGYCLMFAGFCSSFFYLLVARTRVMFFSLPKPVVVLAASFLGYFFEKVGLEVDVALARFSIDLEFILYGFSYFYFELWRGRWFFATAFSVYFGGSFDADTFGASFDVVFLSLEAIFYLLTYFMVYRAILLVVTTAVFLFFSYSLSSLRALGCFLRLMEEHSLNRSSAYCSSWIAQFSTFASFLCLSSFSTSTSSTSAFFAMFFPTFSTTAVSTFGTLLYILLLTFWVITMDSYPMRSLSYIISSFFYGICR